MDMSNQKNSSKSNVYWDSSTDAAIVAFNAETDQYKRDCIFNDSIYTPFLRMAESCFNTFKICYIKEDFDSIYQDVVSFMYMQITKFNPDRVTDDGKKVKAFSYFSIVCKNYLIMLSNKGFKKESIHVPLMVVRSDEDNEVDMKALDITPTDNLLENDELTNKQLSTFKDMVQWYLTNPNTKRSDLQLLQEVRDAIDGKIPFIKEGNAKYSIWLTIANRLGMDKKGVSTISGRMNRLMVYYYRYKLREEFPNKRRYQYKKNLNVTTPSITCNSELRATRICPVCSSTITIIGKNCQYRAIYAKDKPCLQCATRLKRNTKYNKIKI
jgi:hypothetical protein